MPNNLNRRTALTGLCATAAVAVLPQQALALNNAEAKALIDNLVNEINTVINSGKSEQKMYRDFAKIFKTYGDLNIIARTALGVDARSASKQQMTRFVKVFSDYISRKYGRRFREFIGGRLEVKGAKPVKSFYEVKTTAFLRGEAPFDVTFLVSDKSGRNLFFNMFIEGVNMMASERTEIGAMLDKRGGNLDAMIRDLQTAG